MRDLDDIINHRKVEADKKESLISGYLKAYNQYKVERDKLHDERKYDYSVMLGLYECFRAALFI